MRLEQAVVSVCSFSVCAFVLFLNSWHREGRILRRSPLTQIHSDGDPSSSGSVSFPAACSLQKGLRRRVESSILFNFSDCCVEEGEGGRMFLSAWMSQSKIPAERLKIAGGLVVRLEPARRGWRLSRRCLLGRPVTGEQSGGAGGTGCTGAGSCPECRSGWSAPALSPWQTWRV